MIPINSAITLNENEIQEEFVRSSGPGGQNVNKVSTAVQLRFDVAHSASLPDDVRARLNRLAGKRISQDGVLTIKAQRFRTQERNRQDARDQLVDLIRRAIHKPKVRRATQPSLAAQQRRLESKRRRSQTKHLRRTMPSAE
jgi:ribosome-associated protein